MQGFLTEDEKEEDNVCGGLFELESLICLVHAMGQAHCEATASLVIHIHGLHVLIHCLLQHQQQLESRDRQQNVPIVALHLALHCDLGLLNMSKSRISRSCLINFPCNYISS